MPEDSGRTLAGTTKSLSHNLGWAIGAVAMLLGLAVGGGILTGFGIWAARLTLQVLGAE